jgi:hypothetical protein
MKRLWIALAVIVALRLLFVRSVQYVVPMSLWTALFVATLMTGISLIFSFEVPLYRRLAISYLVLTGLIYSVAGILGSDLIGSRMWQTCLVSPYPAISLLRFGIPTSRYDNRWGFIAVTPDPNGDNYSLFSAMVLALGLLAIIAAIAMAWRKRAAYRIWLVLLGFFTLSTIGYVVAGVVGWGMKEAKLAAGLTLSYLVAFLVARVHVDSDAGAARAIGTIERV